MQAIRAEFGSNGPTRMFHVMFNVYNREFSPTNYGFRAIFAANTAFSRDSQSRAL
jgi:hypothetical protein